MLELLASSSCFPPFLEIPGTGALCTLKNLGSVGDETSVTVGSGSDGGVVAAPGAVWQTTAISKEGMIDTFWLLYIIFVPLWPIGRVKVVLRAKLK